MGNFFNKVVGLLYNLYLRFTEGDKLEIKVLKGDYPANTRYVSKGKLKGSVVVESLPGKRMIYTSSSYTPVCLYFPYVYFVIHYTESHSSGEQRGYVYCGMKVGFRQNRAINTLDKVGDSTLSNYSDAFTFCLGVGNSPKGVFRSVRELANAAIKAFWATSFDFCDMDLARMTKEGYGDVYWKSLRERTSIGDLIGLTHEERNGEKFFIYQAEERPSGDGADCSQGRQSAVGQA